MQKYFSLFAFLLLSTFVQAQGQSLGCWDFEETCGNPENAFLEGCIPFALATSGQPGNASNTPGVTAVSGSQYATMDIRHCLTDNRMHGDGIAMNVNVPSGRRIRVSFSYMHEDWFGQYSDSPLMGIHLTSGLSNSGGQGSCVDADAIPGIPQGTVTLGAVNRNSAPANTWATTAFTITTTSASEQLWFRPFVDLAELALNAEYSSRFHLDNVCVTDITCVPDPHRLKICRQEETGELLVTIIGASGVAQSSWQLFKMSDCSNGPGTVWSKAKIKWQTANSFLLPGNSGCYTFGYGFNPPGCSGRFVSSVINTNQEYPICDPTDCVDWSIQVTEQFCNRLRFQVTPVMPFPAGTLITGSINDAFPTILPDGIIDYFPIEDGDNRWIEVCFAVYQPGCETESKCVYRYITNCEGLQGGGSDDRNKAVIELDDKQILRFTNPADQYIRFSAPIEAGVAQLYTMQGALVKSFVLNGTQQLEVGDMPNGQFMLSVQQAGQRDTKLVVIMH